MAENPVSGMFIPMTSITSGKGKEAAAGVYCYPIQIVNVCFVGSADQWVLIDAGVPKSADRIFSEAETRFGKGARPKAIILTHGHFDHIGSIIELAEKWAVPVWSHPLERPFLTGQQFYPDPDPTVEGGMIAKISSFFPNEPINIEEFLHDLPADYSVPFMPGWRWIHTPGHTDGHVSFFHEERKIIIAGDAFVTVRQDSLYKVLVQEAEITGPPRYLTPDWQEAKRSVKKLEALKPDVAVTGHGRPMEGEKLKQGLKNLSDHFEELAVPKHGRYVDRNK